VIPDFWDKFLGIVLILLILEGHSENDRVDHAGIVLAFLVYAFIGPMLPPPWTHRGYDIESRRGAYVYDPRGDIWGSHRCLLHLYHPLHHLGCLFRILGAGRFFIDFSLAAMGGKPTSAGRTVTLASFLLEVHQEGGVATTVHFGSSRLPMLAKAGYSKDAAGGLLSAGGIGAILSPPARPGRRPPFSSLNFKDLLLRCNCHGLYSYLPLLLVNLFDGRIDAKKFGVKEIAFDKTYSLGQLTYLYGFHFISLMPLL